MKFLVVLIILTICVPCFATDYTDDANCNGAWLMEVDEDPITDSSGEGNNGNLKGDGEPDYATASPPDSYSVGYYVFDGNDDYVNCGNGALIEGGTVVCWVYTSDFNTNRAMVAGSDSSELEFRVYQNKMQLLSSYAALLGTSDTSLSGSESTWVHLAVTYDDESTGNYEFFLNGSSDGSGTNATDFHADNSFMIGDNVGTERWAGSLDEVAVFTRELDSTEINDIIDNGLAGGGAPPAASPLKPIIMIF